MNLQNLTIKIPLVKKEDGTFFVEGTRVPLDTIIYLYKDGATPEEVVDRFPTLDLGDVYGVLGYYLGHRDEFELYLTEREQARQAVRRDIEAKSQLTGIRERLLARQKRSA
jgi:uncharacterized protein (DUF433 family)